MKKGYSPTTLQTKNQIVKTILLNELELFSTDRQYYE